MKIISTYITSIFLLVTAIVPAKGQDTVDVPLNIRIGAEMLGPSIYLIDKKTLSAEGNVYLDLNEKTSLMIGGGYSNYSYSQYNYDYRAKGIFFKTGADLNLMGVEKARGKFFAGVGFHYGISISSLEVPSFTTQNYWGTVTSNIPLTSGAAHFLEATPGVRTELFKNFSLGWTINIRWLFHKGMNSDLNPLYLPGFGNAGKSVSSGISYFITFNIPYKNKRVIMMPPPPEEPEEEMPANPAEPGNNYTPFNP
ncbi:MAG TPA: DUF6048 family protein [Bacteroidales bacterium]|nr:DUF6048 family protein [Bacteroidales bacterium]